jgi:5-methyltetrahydrofolate--homocysteine methyltransferase
MIKSDPVQKHERIALLRKYLQDRILVLDGAMGTAIQNLNLSASDFGGSALEGCNENLALSKPALISLIYEDYLRAGADILETNTFGGTPLVLEEYGLSQKAFEINYQAALIARKCADKFSSSEKVRFVAGSIGPTTKAISVTGGITFQELIQNFYEQAKALFEGGVDYFLLETCQDTRNIKAALLGIDRLFKEKGEIIPVAISVTIEPMGTMLAGQSIEALLTSVSHRDLLYLGLNCATGPEFMTDHIRSLASLSRFPVACVPNAGLPDENGLYLETPEMLSRCISSFVKNGWINLVGGCCGTTAKHIEALSRSIQNLSPRRSQFNPISAVSGIDYLEISPEDRPIIVGERTNVIGSKKFKKLILENKFDEASDIARTQIKSGAHLLDVCLANPDRDEFSDMKSFLELAIKKVRAPLMIDSTDEKVIEMALTYSQGKAVINSINLEDGEERFEKVLPLVKTFGAAVVVGTIDDDPQQGMGVTRERKLAIAEREYELLTKKYGIPPEDIYWDPLVFPCATGDKQYEGSAVETIEGIRLLKNRFPNTKTILGISNVSFGLPNAGREVLNSVFLYLCVQAGLDLAIVNSEKLERYASIPDHERKLAEDLLFNRGSDPIGNFADHFRSKKVVDKKDGPALPLKERLANYIIEGSKDGLIDDLNLALKSDKPLDIINGPLMKGMDEVGRLFNSNQLIVAEVLQSAEAMKAAVNHLEPFMEKSETSIRGKVLLATVKGDVHDIGKNLVDIILSNNGFKVINLGIKIPPEQLIAAVKEHQPDMLGLSGLLVKSAQQMVLTASDLTRAGINTPILVGGAALSENFVLKQIAPAYSGTVIYASDAMSGLDIAKKIVDPLSFNELQEELKKKENALSQELPKVSPSQKPTFDRSSLIETTRKVPTPPDFGVHVLRDTPIDHIFRFINPMMVYGRHLGLKGPIARELEKVELEPKLIKQIEAKDPRAANIFRAVQELKEEYRDTPILDPVAVYGFFPAGSFGNRLFIGVGTNGSSSVQYFDFPRQPKKDGLCIADYVNPTVAQPTASDLSDNVAAFVTSVGRGVRELADKLKNQGEYLKSHIIQVLALESAEAYAELLHSQIRNLWGYPDSLEMTMLERFQAKYHGKRYSFGYPACPRLDDQTVLFKILNAEQIGVQLTDGFMMDPEASVSALVFHHPQASYFSVGVQNDDSIPVNPRLVI